jgi:anti-anti-sigma factor
VESLALPKKQFYQTSKESAMAHSASNGTIGILTPYSGGVYYGGVLVGAREAARRHGLRLLVAQVALEGLIESRLAFEHIDGWVAVNMVEHVQALAQLGIPTVTVSTQVDRLPAVLSDNYGGMFAAVRHLIEHGHRQIAFIGRLANYDINQRFQGYQAALHEYAIPFDTRLVVEADDELEETGRYATRQLIASGAPFTAVAGGTDKNAFGVLDALRESGYRVPADIAVVGFDDLSHAQTTDPPLTTVRQRFDSLGMAAVDLLQAMRSGQTADTLHAVPTALVLRRSCGCTNAADLVPIDTMLGDSVDVAVLAQQLLQAMFYPVVPDRSLSPAQIWPGITAILDALTSAPSGGAPNITAIAQAWQEAVAISSDLDVLTHVFSRLEDAAHHLLALHSHGDAHNNMRTTLQTIHKEMMRACLAQQAAQVTYLDSMVFANNQISTAILGSIGADNRQLDWLRYTQASTGWIGHWADPEHTTLSIVATYTRDPQTPLPSGVCTSAAFPPFDQNQQQPGEHEDTFLLPLRSARHDWGILALCGSITPQVAWNSDPLAMWAQMLNTALNHAELLSDLAGQQQTLQAQQRTLQESYDRERVLATTIRELGCPIIPLRQGILLVPLIGAIDSTRAQQIIRTVLSSVQREQATNLLIDVTGVSIIDTQVARALIDLARSVRLLGAETTLVGIRPEIAQSIISLGIELSSLSTQPTLAAALGLLHPARAVRHDQEPTVKHNQ